VDAVELPRGDRARWSMMNPAWPKMIDCGQPEASLGNVRRNIALARAIRARVFGQRSRRSCRNVHSPYLPKQLTTRHSARTGSQITLGKYCC
jgi:hypothetical protein